MFLQFKFQRLAAPADIFQFLPRHVAQFRVRVFQHLLCGGFIVASLLQ